MARLLISALSIAILVAVLSSCGSAPAPVRAAPETQLTIAQGAGNWVTFEQEIALDTLIDGTLALPYAATGTTGALPTSAVKRIVLHFRPTPLQPEDRCGLHLQKVSVITADGREHAVAATGHVTDNSDGLRGMRVEIARNGSSGLVIPARASATVVFDQPVQVELVK